MKNQAASHTDELWLDGVQSYQDHVAKMLQDFKDIVGEEVVGKYLPGCCLAQLLQPHKSSTTCAVSGSLRTAAAAVAAFVRTSQA